MATGDASSAPSHPPLPHRMTHMNYSWHPSHNLRKQLKLRLLNFTEINAKMFWPFLGHRCSYITVKALKCITY